MMISFARAGPTRRTKRVVVATPSGTPSSTSGIQNWASLAAQRKSQASASPQPPPIAWPLSAASVTCSRFSSRVLARSKRRRNWLFRSPNARRRSSGDIFALRGASAPAETTGGAPVTITTRVPASSRRSANVTVSSASIASLREFLRSGRFSVTVAIAPSRTSVTFSPMTRGPYHTRGRPRKRARLAEEAERGCRGRPAGEERRRRHAEVTRRDLGEERSEIRRHRKVARLEEPGARESRPATVDAAAAHGPSQRQHRGRVAVVGAAVAVLRDGAPELRHGEHHDVGHPVAQVLGERGERAAEVTQAEGEPALLGALAHVGVPTLHVGERDLEPDVRLDEPRDLFHRLAEGAARIRGAVGRRDPRGVRRLEHLHGLERLAPRPREEVAHALRVERLEAAPGRLVGGADVEALDGLHRHG